MSLTFVPGRRTVLPLIGALLVSSLLTPAAPAAPSAVPLEGGSFSWGIKQSFLSYVVSPAAGGVVEGQDGASYSDGQFHFPVDVAESTVDTSGNGTLILEGAAVIKAHEGLGENGGWGLDLRYDDLTLTIEGQSATLTADYHVTGAAGRGGEGYLDRSGDDVTLITFTLDEPVNLEAGTVNLSATETVVEPGLTESLPNYQPGSKLDGADLTLTFGQTGTIGASLSSRGSSR